MGSPIGLIAGEGHFPSEIARAAQVHGERIVAIALRGLANPDLSEFVHSYKEVYLGQVEAILHYLRDIGCERVILAGKVSKGFVFENLSELRPDARALELWRGLSDRKDDSVLLAVAEVLEREGFTVLEQCTFTPELLAKEGVLGKIEPTEKQLKDVAFAWPIAKTLGDLDIGQTVVVKDKAVFSLEAIEGTDLAIRRGGQLSGSGSCVVKVSKPHQDPRFDIPAIGLESLQIMIEVRAEILAVEAHKTLLLQKEEFLQSANNHGIVVIGATGGRLWGID